MDDRPHKILTLWRPVGWLVTVLALAFVVRWILQLDIQVWQSLERLEFLWLLAGVAAFQIWFLMRYLAWEAIVRRHDPEIDRCQSLRSWTISELIRYVPGNIWSFAAKYRISLVGHAKKSNAIQTLFIEAIGLVGGASLTALLVLETHRSLIILIAFVLFASLATLSLRAGRRILRWPEGPRLSFRESSLLLLWYALVWIVFGMASAMIYWSFVEVPEITLRELIGYNVAAWLIGYISIVTPMGLGVREVAFVRLTKEALPGAIASLVSLVTRLILVLSELVFLGIVLLWSVLRDRKSAHDSEPLSRRSSYQEPLP